MSNEYYDHTTYPATSSTLASSPMRSELDFIEAGFDKLPALTGNGGKLTAINAGGTAMEAITTTGTGSGVRATSPTLVTPDIGAANATSINRVNIAGVATGATLAIADNSSLATIGGYAAAFVFTGATNVTVPTTGTLLTSATPVASLAGGAAGQIAYQSATDVTSFVPVGAVGRALVSNGSSPPEWTNGALSLGGNLSTVGALATIGNFSANLTFTGNTAVTFPTSGVLALAGANTDITSLSNVTVPTQAAGNSSGLIASTEFATGAITNATKQIQNISAVATSNTMVVSVNPTTLGFRSTNLSSGVVTPITLGATSNLTIPQGATLGAANSNLTRIAAGCAVNNGTIVPIVGGANVNLDESVLINVTNISNAANSSNVFYSNVNLTNVPWRSVGFFDSNQSTAGTYATQPALVQGVGGNVVLGKFGYVQFPSIATTSGTTQDQTGIPNWARRITIRSRATSTNGTSAKQIQIGAGSIVTSGYLSQGSGGTNGNVISGFSSTSGFGLGSASFAGNTNYFSAVLCNEGNNIWSYTATNSGNGAQSEVWVCGGELSLGGTLDRIRLTMVNGTDAFDGGSFTVLVEG